MVVIESVIKTNPLGRWYIELSDTMKEESMEICLDINEYAQKVALDNRGPNNNINELFQVGQVRLSKRETLIFVTVYT